MLRTATLVTVIALLFAPAPVQAFDGANPPIRQDNCEDSEDPVCPPLTPDDEDHNHETEQPDAPTVTTIYVTETVIVEEIVPVEQVVTIEQVVPVTETVYVEEVVTVVVTEVVPVEQVVTIEQIVPVTETVYVEEVVTVVVTEVVPVEQVVTIEQIVPVTETVYVEEVVTVVVTEVVLVEQIVPVTETVYVEEVVTVVVTEVFPVEQIVIIEQIIPVTQTLFVTETITPQPAPSSPPPPVTDSVTTTTSITTSQAIGVALAQPAALHHWSQLLPPYDAPTPLPVTGLAMYYAPNVMDGVEAYRERVNGMEECEECVGRVALLRAGDLGRKVWIRVDGDGAAEGPFQVLDVAARHHIPDLLRRNWVVDVDYTTASRWGMQGPVMVTVYAAPPAPQTVMQLATPAEPTPQ